MRCFFMPLSVHIQTDKLGLLSKIVLSPHYRAVTSNTVLINITCKLNTDLVLFLPAGNADPWGYRQRTHVNPWEWTLMK